MLIHEKSPYLLQHAYNPVEWYPWGKEAFQKAKAEDKPIFLSIGYSTCHWCHVMEKESFENEEVARLINDTFVPIKVDREERPDIDSIYMSVCQALTGRGGWPLTVFMTPEKKPFLAATYIPRESRFGVTGMLDLIPILKQTWAQKREELISNADQIVSAISEASKEVQEATLDRDVLERTYQMLRDNFDPTNGGFGSAPKFPTPHHLTFLLRYWKRTGDNDALEMVERTLQAMRRGGIYDHIGFGFHRYSTDKHWLVPHFEKMLYDQALISIAFTEAYQVTHEERYEKVVREIFRYLIRDMLSPEGAFYSAEDADSEGEEGKFYVWTEDEIEEVLEKDEAEFIKKFFNTSPGGNFIEEATRSKTGTNILHQKKDLEDFAAENNMDFTDLEARYETIRQKLFDHREKRIRPAKDDKILTDWNGLMIVALAKASAAFDDKEYMELAVRVADFIISEMQTQEGRLLHRYREGEAAVEAFLEDYAFFIWGLTELYQVTFNTEYLKQALKLNEHLVGHFLDKENGGFFHTADYSESLLYRNKDVYDGASPSGNSLCALNLLQLGRMTADTTLEGLAKGVFDTFASQVQKVPLGYTQLLNAFDFAIGPSREIVVVGKSGDENTEELLSCIHHDFIPNKVLVFKPSRESSEIGEMAGFVTDMEMKDGKATAYICENYNCSLPVNNREEVYKQLKTDD